VESKQAGEQLLTPTIQVTLARAQISQERFDAARQTIDSLEKQSAGGPMAAMGTSMRSVIDFAEAIGNQPDGPQFTSAVEQIKKQKLAAISVKNTALATGSNDDMRLLFTLPERLAVASYQVLLQDFESAIQTLDTVDQAIAVQADGYQKAVKAGAFNSDEASVALADQRVASSELRQQILVKSGKIEAALEEAERHRGEAQAELMRRKLEAEANTDTQSEMDLKQIVATAAEMKTTLVVYSLVHALDPETRSYFSPANKWANPNQIYIWIVPPTGEITFRSVSLDRSLSRLVELARQDLTKTADPRDDTGTRDGLSSKEALSELGKLLIDPISKYLPKQASDHVTFVPQGALFLVPFAALPDADGTPLVVKHTISTVPSIEILSLSKRQRVAAGKAGAKDVLIVGNPAMPAYQSRPDRAPTPLGQLPGAEAEAKFLGELMQVQPLIGDAASETAVVARMPNARIIHLATHGLLESENMYARSYLSAIALGPSNAEDGFLTVRETMRMKLNAELAVLSACDTGRGRISGDGVIGLSRGYIAAGVPSIVVSLWPVSDAATKELMSSFYKEMLAGKDKAGALRAAMLETRKKFPTANAWAPFTIYGYPR
jgi:CHAT domain-containing protein